MSIKVIEDGPAIVMTRSEYTRAMREYRAGTCFAVDPPTFEEWVRDRQKATARLESLREMIAGNLAPGKHNEN